MTALFSVFVLKMILYTFTAFLLSADRFYKIFRTIPDFALSLELISLRYQYVQY